MRILSVHQPWATLIALGIKNVENRTWSTGYRGTLLIHASKSPMDEFDVMKAKRLCREAGVSYPETFPTGGIIGSVELTGVIWIEGLRVRTDHQTVKLDELHGFNGDAYGFILEKPRAFPALIPMRGSLGLTIPTEEILAAIPA
jgi:hypothetical protein